MIGPPRLQQRRRATALPGCGCGTCSRLLRAEGVAGSGLSRLPPRRNKSGRHRVRAALPRPRDRVSQRRQARSFADVTLAFRTKAGRVAVTEPEGHSLAKFAGCYGARPGAPACAWLGLRAPNARECGSIPRMGVDMAIALFALPRGESPDWSAAACAIRAVPLERLWNAEELYRGRHGSRTWGTSRQPSLRSSPSRQLRPVCSATRQCSGQCSMRNPVG